MKSLVLIILFIVSLGFSVETLPVDSDTSGDPTNGIVFVVSTLFTILSAYFLLARGIFMAVIKLQNGIIKFWEKWKNVIEGDIQQDFKNLIIVPFDDVLEKTADILQRLHLKKSAQKLRDIIKIE